MTRLVKTLVFAYYILPESRFCPFEKPAFSMLSRKSKWSETTGMFLCTGINWAVHILYKNLWKTKIHFNTIIQLIIRYHTHFWISIGGWNPPYPLLRLLLPLRISYYNIILYTTISYYNIILQYHTLYYNSILQYHTLYYNSIPASSRFDRWKAGLKARRIVPPHITVDEHLIYSFIIFISSTSIYKSITNI